MNELEAAATKITTDAIEVCIEDSDWLDHQEAARTELVALKADLDKWREVARFRHETLNMMALQSNMMRAEIESLHRIINRLDGSHAKAAAKAYIAQIKHEGDTQ